ncbi:MAG TPA: hypothetical protein VM492_13270 [Sumerlaeia bacterium]|nr:hypothetical protein [Sumerlaeia bacterium]
MNDPIASTELVAILPSGEKKRIRIEIGTPCARDAGDAACSVAMAGLYDNLHDAIGVDTFQALALAVSFVRQTLRGLTNKGWRITLPDDDDEGDSAGDNDGDLPGDDEDSDFDFDKAWGDRENGTGSSRRREK